MTNNPKNKIYWAVIDTEEDLNRAELMVGIELAKELKQDIRIIANRELDVTTYTLNCVDYPVLIYRYDTKAEKDKFDVEIYAENQLLMKGYIQCGCGKKFGNVNLFTEHYYHEPTEEEILAEEQRRNPFSLFRFPGLGGTAKRWKPGAMPLPPFDDFMKTFAFPPKMFNRSELEYQSGALSKIINQGFMKNSILDIINESANELSSELSVIENHINIMNYIDRRA
jgi:hypothetical protein